MSPDEELGTLGFPKGPYLGTISLQYLPFQCLGKSTQKMLILQVGPKKSGILNLVCIQTKVPELVWNWTLHPDLFLRCPVMTE